MAIRIIGKAPEAMKTCTCRNCAVVLEYTQADTVEKIHYDYAGGSDMYRTLQCPSCGTKINVTYR